MDVIKIIINSNYDLQIVINKWLILLTVFIFILWVVKRNNKSSWTLRSLEINQIELGIGNQKVVIKPNIEVKQIAYKLWVELSTRKIGLPIDFEHDVIDEIYDSWYEFFKLTRELIKSIPVNKVNNNEDTLRLVNTAIDVLNDGLRPHLTKWQARFRKWLAGQNGIFTNQYIHPQDLQKRFPDYDDLANDMMVVNQRLIYYRELLRKIAIGD